MPRTNPRPGLSRWRATGPVAPSAGSRTTGCEALTLPEKVSQSAISGRMVLPDERHRYRRRDADPDETEAFVDRQGMLRRADTQPLGGRILDLDSRPDQGYDKRLSVRTGASEHSAA